MKYKVGDEVLVKARIIEVKEGEKYPYKIKRSSNLADNIYVGESDIVQKPDMTAEEAWEITKKILFIPSLGGIEDVDLQGIFGTCNIMKIMKNNSPQEAKAKIEAWEAENEIKAGDEVEFDDTANDIHRSMYVTSKYNDTDYCGICRNGDTYCVHKSSLKKTGRHIDIEGLLKQIGGDE